MYFGLAIIGTTLGGVLFISLPFSIMVSIKRSKYYILMKILDKKE
jgi:hypothetical protein